MIAISILIYSTINFHLYDNSTNFTNTLWFQMGKVCDNELYRHVDQKLVCLTAWIDVNITGNFQLYWLVSVQL